MKRSAFSFLLLLAALRANPPPPVIVLPNADGILDVAGISQNEPGEAITNPFQVRYHPRIQVREMTLAVSSVLVGPDAASASAILNGELYSPGDAWEGLSVTTITGGMIELRLGKFILQVPVEDRPLRVRLAR